MALKKKKSPLLIRRVSDGKLDKLKTGKKTDRNETKKYMNCFRQIYHCLNKYEGESLYEKYLVQFRELLTQMTPEVLQYVFENTYAEFI